MTKDEELARLYAAYDEQQERFKELFNAQAEAHRYQWTLVWSMLDFHWQLIKARMQ